MTRSRKLAELAAAYQSGAPLVFRNRIINGSAMVAQRGVVALASVAAVYATDRFLMGVVSGTGIAANAFKSAYTGSSSGYGHYISGSMTGGTPYWCQRIEQINVADLNSKSVTVSGLLFQDTGSSQTFSLRLTKATALDNWSSAGTVLGTNSSIVVPSGVSTPFSVTFNLGATDANTGLMVEVYTAATVTCTSKNFALTDLQLEKGSVATPFEVRPIGAELALCQRYLPFLQGVNYSYPCAGLAQSSTVANVNYVFSVKPRVPPTGMIVTGVAGFGATTQPSAGTASSFAFQNASYDACNFMVTTNGAFTTGMPLFMICASNSSSIQFTGCEL